MPHAECEPKERDQGAGKKKQLGEPALAVLSCFPFGSGLCEWVKLDLPTARVLPLGEPWAAGRLGIPFWQSTTQKHILPVNRPIKKANVFKQEDLLA